MCNIDIFKNRIKERCKKTGISQKYLCDSVNKSKQYLNNIWDGKCSPTKEELEVFANILGTTPAYLSGETDEPNQTYADINSEDVKYIDMFRSLPSDNKEIIKKLIEQMSKKG